MDDEGTTKAPVTRLRRRLSVEAEEVKSPSGITTPTKKRGGRLAAKPQLDLIDENASETPSKRVTRKTAAKAVVELAEEMALTPSRRSARIKSNSSIISETTSYESPRTRRAARRLSQAGSDNETSTPARQTRRTRKDSTSSIDKQVDNTTIAKTPNISKAITEEPETNNGDSETNSITRKSPRFVEKNNKDAIPDKSIINISDSDRKSNVQSDGHKQNPVVTIEAIEVTGSTITESNNECNVTIKDKEPPTINNSCDNLLINLNEKPQKIVSLKNKSCTALDSSNIFSNKRNRTKSWTSISVDHSNYDNFYSDNEISKKKKKNNTSHNNRCSGDSVTFTKKTEKKKSFDNEKENTSTLSIKEKSFTDYKSNDPPENVKGNHSSLESPKKTNIYKTTEDMLSMPRNVTDSNPTVELFNNAPGIHVRSLIFLDDDSDSNTNISSKHKQSQGQDQCVPIVHQVHAGDNLKSNISYEPMDVDETLAENVSINILHESNATGVSECDKPISMCKSLISVEENIVPINNSNKSIRKYSGTYLESQNLEKTNNENKSTLILSQIKGTSGNEIINTSTQHNNNEQLSKSVNVSDIATKKKSNKANLSQNYLTSTPIQQKLFNKTGIQIETSLLSPKNISNEQIDYKISLKDHHISETESHIVPDNKKEEQEMSLIKKSKYDSGQSSSQDESDVETSGKQNSLIDDEAEEASDNYESGDSQNEEDKEYERNNEIPEKGETLNSEEDFSDDSEYEKDSFIVSSAEEDHELLSGSGDNLSMSDNELNMSSKSKKKYNDRKVKEQKEASREMYNARHKLNESQSSDDNPKIKKKNRQRLDSSALKSDDEQVKSQENSKITNNVTECDLNDISSKKKKKVKSLSKSECDEEPENEKEITILNTSKIGKEDPLFVQIKEEIQSPQKSFNISTVPVNDAIEEVNVNENMSVTNLSESLDPLQGTVAIDDEEYSSNSENEEIIDNYNSILKDLNKNTKKMKSIEISLNEDKQKKKTKERILDELNLSLSKTKKNKKKSLQNGNEMLQYEFTKKTDRSIEQSEDDKASDSIDMRLLFPEDSNDSEHNSDKLKESTKIVNLVLEDIELKGIENRTNIGASMGNESNDDVAFFIDTKGTREDDASDDISIKHSAKKSKSKNNTSDLLNNEGETDDLPLEIKYTSERKKKNKSSSQTSTSISEEITQESIEMNIKSSAKKNKKTKLSLSTSIDETIQNDIKDFDDAPVEIKDITHSDKKKKKHSKKHTDHSDITNTEIQTTELTMPKEELPEPTSATKKKKAKQSLNLSSAEIIETDVLELDELPEEVLHRKDKKKKHSKDNSYSKIEVHTMQSDNPAPEESSANISSDKKKKSEILQDSFNKSSTNTGNQDDQDTEEAPVEVLNHSNRKKKHTADNLQSNTDAGTIQLENTVPEEAPANGKKKKKSKILLNESSKNIENQENFDTEEASNETSYQIHKKKKHAKQYFDNVETNIEHLENISSPAGTASLGSPKKGSILNPSPLLKKTQPEVPPDDHVKKEAVTSKKRKREILPEFTPVDSNPTSENTSNVSQGNQRKKRKIFQNNDDTGITVRKNKKRKERDDEDLTEVSKVLKQSSADKVFVQRLPSHVLSQLEDKPRKNTKDNKKPKVISTTDFLVEEEHKAKRNKPSNYLEESVYINDTPILKKEKKTVKKPKVLPFIPTASTSDEGFTTNFRINVLPGDDQFTAQSTNVTDFKTNYLHESRLKKIRTFEKYKSQRKYKISKF